MKQLVNIVPAYIIFVLILGAFRAWLFPHLGFTEGNHILAIVGFSIAGMLFVIPTAAEIPIIQSFMSFGLGAGPAGALLLSLPAVSLPSLLMISRSYPKRALVIVALSVVVLAILSGLVMKRLQTLIRLQPFHRYRALFHWTSNPRQNS